MEFFIGIIDAIKNISLSSDLSLVDSIQKIIATFLSMDSLEDIFEIVREIVKIA